jgi:hypothetical protein
LTALPTPTWTSTVSDAPQRAPADFRGLPRVVRIWTSENWPEARGTWQGSGFDPRKFEGARWWHLEGARTCAACRSARTRCVYLHADPGQWGIVMHVELECRECGKFTLWDGED